jgi:hypothetical protein
VRVGRVFSKPLLQPAPGFSQFGRSFGQGEDLHCKSSVLGVRIDRADNRLAAFVDMAVSANVLNERERPEYIMAHSLAHALMTEVAIDCGYPASALKERIYLLPRLPGQPIQCGILIYTASAGNQGTLGGLVEITHRFAKVLKSALERERLCSGDPVCADHDPVRADDDRMLHGAACHGCLLISETSCEARNVLLDRVLLVDTVGPTGAAYF